jgi:tripartite-type tricarboxylate transporter receptor subunit TctC
LFNQKIGRRSFIQCAASAAALVPAFAVLSQTRPFPAKPITIIVPYPPGGSADIVARALSQPLTRHAGQSIVVDNRAGGGGSVGTGWAARADSDGHTLLVGPTSQLSVLPQMIKVPYSFDSLVPIALVTRTPVAVVVRANDPRIKTAGDFLNVLKAKGEAVTIGHAGPGTPNHLALLQLEDASNTRVNAVPYKGSGPALLDLIGGQIDAVIDQSASSAPHIKSGGLRAVLVLGPQAQGVFANVPTLAQAGLTAFDSTTIVGLYAPKGIPAATVATLSGWISKSVAEPEFSNVIRDLSSEPKFESASILQRLVNEEGVLAARLVKQGRLKAE